MGGSRKHVLVIGKDASIDRIAPMLRRSDFSVHSVDPSPFLLDLVLTTPFEVVIVSYPMDSVPLDDLVAAMRDRGSACHGAGLLLLSDPKYLDGAQDQVDLGANRAICSEWSEARVMQSISDLLDIAPRVGMRVTLRARLMVDDISDQLDFRTVNVSISGALLEGAENVKPGENISYLFRLPGGGLIEGTAEIVRPTNRMREGVEGFGARFATFGGISEQRLLDHIQRQIDLGAQVEETRSRARRGEPVPQIKLGTASPRPRDESS